MDSLAEFGLSMKESDIYIALLKDEELTANQLSRKTQINRSVVYSYLDSLMDKGLVSFLVKNNTKHFRAAKPETLLHYLKEKEQKLKDLMPKLKSIKKESSEDISVELYRGVEGGITIMKDIIRTKKAIMVLGYKSQPEEIMPVYMTQYVRQLNENRIKEKILAIKGEHILIGKQSEVRYLPKEFEIPTSTIIYGDKVVVVVYSHPYFSVLIKSKEIADSYRRFFELLWVACKNIDE